jgi:hypothetical protein
MNLELLNSVLKYLRETQLSKLIGQVLVMGLLCIILSFCYVIAFHFTNLLGIYTEAHDIRNFSSNLQGNMQSDGKLEDILKNLLQGTQANRAYMYRYHNGLAAISGVPFYFQSMTFEVIRPGTVRIMPYEQRLPAGMTPSISSQFAQNKCALATDLDKTDHTLNFMFQIHGTRALLRCPIFMKNGDLFGLVGIDYTDKPTGIPGNAQHSVEISAGEIAAIYSNLKR